MERVDPIIADAPWQARDLAVLWHPCTQMREHPHTLPLVPIARGESAWLIGHDGRRYLDAVSSWWTNLFGHAEPRIADAIAAQARTLEQVILAGFSHAPAVELAERLLALAPREKNRAPLAKVFYADNGSAGVEVALKMAFHWFHNRGEHRRTRFVALENGYHGETPEQAADRELKEEAGYGARSLQVLRTITLAPTYMSHQTQLVLARDLYPERLPGDEPEELEVVPWKLDALDQLILREEFSEGRSIAALFLVREWLRSQGASA